MWSRTRYNRGQTLTVPLVLLMCMSDNHRSLSIKASCCTVVHQRSYGQRVFFFSFSKPTLQLRRSIHRDLNSSKPSPPEPSLSSIAIMLRHTSLEKPWPCNSATHSIHFNKTIQKKRIKKKNKRIVSLIVLYINCRFFLLLTKTCWVPQIKTALGFWLVSQI